MTPPRGGRGHGHPPIGGLLAAAPAPANGASDSWGLAVAGLLILAVVGFLAAMRVRRWANARGDHGGSGFSLDELDAMRSRGELTDAQWKAARQSVMGRIGAGDAPSGVRERP
jgi:hypothetical protein